MELLEQEISRIEESIDKYDEVDTFVMSNSIDAITKAGYKLEAVEPLLQLFERHPTTYFGDPGEIVHFIEQFRGEYEKYLIVSVKRMPTLTTVWMLNRCINAGKQAEELLGIMKKIVIRKDVDTQIIERTQDYIDFQANH